VGLEPTMRFLSPDYKSGAIATMRNQLIVEQVGIEPTFPVLQTGTLTNSVTAPSKVDPNDDSNTYCLWRVFHPHV
jgi:hypothetical protein